MADDGTGVHITIPSVFVSKYNGLQLIKHLIISAHLSHSNDEQKKQEYRLIIDVSSRAAPVIKNARGGADGARSPPVEFSLQSLRHVGILPEHIISQIAQGLLYKHSEDIASEVKESTLRDEQQLKDEE
jgi:hypothetical protein